MVILLHVHKFDIYICVCENLKFIGKTSFDVLP